MNDDAAIFFILALLIVAMSVIVLAWIKHRAAPKAVAGDTTDARRHVEMLSDENAGLRRQVGRLEERLAVLERIATDPAERTAREIEQLR